jgi:RNA polymerase sigma-70 factor (family 1)
MQNIPDDKELLVQVMAGDRESFDSLFLKYYSVLIWFCKSVGCTESNAEDVVSDVFLDLWQRRSKLVVHTSLKAYLYAAVKNRANLLYRNQKGISFLTQEYADELPDAHHSRPDEKLMLKDRSIIIEHIISGLPEQTRLVFLMKWKHQLTDKEIAEALHKSVHTVRTLVYRAILYIRQNMPNVK